jgi:hypothetical protein
VLEIEKKFPYPPTRSVAMVQIEPLVITNARYRIQPCRWELGKNCQHRPRGYYALFFHQLNEGKFFPTAVLKWVSRVGVYDDYNDDDFRVETVGFF